MEKDNDNRKKDGDALNALKYGLTSRSTIIPGENEQTFRQLQRDYSTHFSPVGELESVLVHRITIMTWRLMRCERTEAAIYRRQFLLAEITNTQEESVKYAVMVDPTQEMMPMKPSLRITDAVSYAAALERIQKLKQATHAPATATGGLFYAIQEGLVNLSRYETSIERSLYRALHELKYLQDKRGHPNPMEEPGQAGQETN